MRLYWIAAAAAGLASSASAMPVSTFLTKAEALQRKGPMAIFSSDLKLLMGQIKGDAAALRAENKAAEGAGRPKAYCTPAGGVKLTNRDILDAMKAVPPAQRTSTETKAAPPAQRTSTETKAALRTYFARRFPCRA